MKPTRTETEYWLKRNTRLPGGSILIYPAQDYTVNGVTAHASAHAAIAVKNIVPNFTPLSLANTAAYMKPAAGDDPNWSASGDLTYTVTSVYNRTKYMEQVYSDGDIQKWVKNNAPSGLAGRRLGFTDYKETTGKTLGRCGKCWGNRRGCKQ